MEKDKGYLIICIEFGCNNNCKHCMIEKTRDSIHPISFEEYKKVLDENLKSKKYNCLVLSGAEVTMNKDLEKFAKYAKDLGCFEHIQIQTNGRKLSDYKYCKNLVDSGIDEFFLSVCGHNEEIHDLITCVNGSFAETLQGIKNIDSMNAKIITNTVITRLNYVFLPDIVKRFSSFSSIGEMQFWCYWVMGKEDKNDLLESFKNIKPHLLEAIELGKDKKTKIVVRNFPECLLGSFKSALDNSRLYMDSNSRARLLPAIIKANEFGQCLFRKNCQSSECNGLTTAYIRKFGWDEDELMPIKDKNYKPIQENDTDYVTKYFIHKKKFNIKDNIYLKLFEDTLNASSNYYLDCSVKIQNNKLNATRFNIWYRGEEHIKNINLIFNFFKKISAYPKVNIDYSLIKKIFDREFYIKKIEQPIMGVDFRDNLNDSRIKIWFKTKDYPEKMRQVLSIHGYNKDVLDLIMNNRFLFGFDFYFDGRTRLKIYPTFNEEELHNEDILKKLKNLFSDKVFSLIKECHMLDIFFKDEDFNKILHFHPNNMETFINKLENRKVENISGILKNINFSTDQVISLDENETNKNKIENISFYY